jgi:hypothetical protein
MKYSVWPIIASSGSMSAQRARRAVILRLKKYRRLRMGTIWPRGWGFRRGCGHFQRIPASAQRGDLDHTGIAELR